MNYTSRYGKFLIQVLALAFLSSACTKARQAELPYEMQKSVFAISEFGETQTENSPFTIETDDSPSSLGLGNSSKATAEKGLVPLSDIQVPKRLKYMFSGLEVTGQTDRTYPITFSVDKQFVTAYKVVTNPSELSILEKHLAQVQEEVVLQKQLQKNQDRAKAKTLLAALQKARDGKATLLSQKSATLLVPLFKFKVAKFGVLEREKNQLKEETSTLSLTETDWTEATHILLNTTTESRLAVGLDPSQSGDLDRTFVMDRINNKIMTAATLTSEFQIPVNLPPEARVLTLLDVKALHVFEVTQSGKADLTDSQLRQLKSGANGNVRHCPKDVAQTLPPEAQKDCILILRYDVAVDYVRPELPVVDHDGNQDSRVNFKSVLSNRNVGLVQIPKDVEPSKIESNNMLDPNTTVRIADIRNREFFFRRTLEDAAYTVNTPGLAPGMAGAITIVKFELEEDRLVLRRADKLINYKTTSNDSDYEELMSLPVKYLKLEAKDATGAEYSMPRVVPASRNDAQYIEVDWTRNSIPQDFSPYAAVYDGCTLGTANVQVADMDMRLSAGVLNFSQKYTLALRPECIAVMSTTNDYNGAPSYQYTARVSERISLMAKDSSSDKPFIAAVPFKVQNALGYGVWTLAQINPDDNGNYGREGTETNLQMVHDFRNGKTLVYTVTGLPTDDPELRKTLTGIVEELVAAWNLAYKQAFKGSALERTGPYITYQISGEDGVTGRLGDLDRNIFHFENKYANHGILGVSQVGFNPRSGIVVSDSLILYTGNVKQDVARSFEQMSRRATWEKSKEEIRAKAVQNMKRMEEADKKAANGGTLPPEAPLEEKLELAKAITRRLIEATQNSKNPTAKTLQPKNVLGIQKQVQTTVQQRQALGGHGGFAYSAPKDESAWMDNVLRAMTANPDLTVSDIHGAIAKEILAAKGSKLSATDRANLSQAVLKTALKNKMQSNLKNSPSCFKSESEVANGNFVKLSFNEAFRIEALNTMVHEMGHSQGLTHNFMGSYDKGNFANEDGSPSKRNYSSVMDYLTPGKFNWDGLGTYDIRAIRASHLGLFEVSPQYKKHLGAAAEKSLVRDQYITLAQIKSIGGKEGWANFTKAKIKGVLKDYKYCTDINVGWDLMCQRHDFGTTPVEVVDSLISDWEDNYLSNYHAWDRNEFSLAQAYRGPAMSQYVMWRMRKFLDETFYLSQTRSVPQEELKSYVAATIKVYNFLNQLINTPDTRVNFQSPARFTAVPYIQNLVDDQGRRTGKTVSDIALVERRALKTFSVAGDQTRIDTMGLEFDKIAAMNLLTMQGYPNSKYSTNSIYFSFVDFENIVLGLHPTESRFVNNLAGIMLDKLPATHTLPNGLVLTLPGEKAGVSSTLRAYAGIYGILNLESSTLRNEENFANLFKVGSSVGQAPNDRVVLNRLGVSENSKARLGFWALDDASAAEVIIAEAARKNLFIQNEPQIQPLMEQLFLAQLEAAVSATTSADKQTPSAKALAQVDKAQKSLLAKLTDLNRGHQIVHPEMAARNPAYKLENQVGNLMQFNAQFIDVSVAMVSRVASEEDVSAFAEMTQSLGESLPIFAAGQKAIVAALQTKEKLTPEQKPIFAALGQISNLLLDENTLETSYALIMKNVEYLNSLTLMTNPEYNR